MHTGPFPAFRVSEALTAGSRNGGKTVKLVRSGLFSTRRRLCVDLVELVQFVTLLSLLITYCLLMSGIIMV